MHLRVLVVDDSVTFRRIIIEALAGIPGVEVVGYAGNGRLALARLRELRPDAMTLDMEMPELDGIGVLEAMRAEGLSAGAVVVSSHTQRGGVLTLKALRLGAFDFLTKPVAGDPVQAIADLRRGLAPLLKALATRREVQALLRGDAVPAHGASIPGPAAPQGSLPRMVLVGVSTGGPVALERMLSMLPSGLGVPVLVVQHMPPLFTRSLAESLSERCSIRIKEAAHLERAEQGCVYIAPGGRHMKVLADAQSGIVIHVTDDPPEHNCKPSVDYLFRSAALGFPGRACAVILTGMGNDGVLGLKLLKRHGAYVIAQDEASCVVFGMPREAILAGVVDVVAPLDRIAEELCCAVRGRGFHAHLRQ